MAPEALSRAFVKSAGRIDGATAAFGAPFYGERILGRLVWGESKTGHNHCVESDYDVPAPSEDLVSHGDYKSVRLIHIVMVRRGVCSMVTKVKVAKKKGAHAVVIVDYENSVLDAAGIKRLVPSDDGYGDKIDIPSVLISRYDGAPLIEYCKSTNNQVIVEMAWEVPKNHVLQLDMWMSSGSKTSQQLLKAFSPMRKSLNENIKFVPHYHIFSLGAKEHYQGKCTAVDGKYCAEDPDADGPITGRDVVEEDIRQLCIHDFTKVKNINMDDNSAVHSYLEYAEAFWIYVEKFPEACPFDAKEEDARFGKACSEKLMGSVGIDIDAIKKCVRETTSDKLKHEAWNTAWAPDAIRINGWIYGGTKDAHLLTRAICSGFTKRPAVCETLLHPVDVRQEQWWTPPKRSGVSIGTFFGVLAGALVVLLAGLFVYKRSLSTHIHMTLREEVMLEVQSQMSSYKQLP